MEDRVEEERRDRVEEERRDRRDRRGEEIRLDVESKRQINSIAVCKLQKKMKS